MKINGIKSRISYKDSIAVPNDYIQVMGSSDENVLKLSIIYENDQKMKSFYSNYYLVYFDDESKKLAFRAMKLMAITLTLLKAHHDLDNVNQETMLDLVEKYAEVFGIELNGLLSFRKVKDMINNDILKDINPEYLPYYRLELMDIVKGPAYSKVRRFDINVDYNNTQPKESQLGALLKRARAMPVGSSNSNGWSL